jgi:hypothetical protein
MSIWLGLGLGLLGEDVAGFRGLVEAERQWEYRVEYQGIKGMTHRYYKTHREWGKWGRDVSVWRKMGQGGVCLEGNVG